MKELKNMKKSFSRKNLNNLLGYSYFSESIDIRMNRGL